MNTLSSNGELHGTVALVTGGGRGMGLAIVDELLKNGAYVSLIDINEEIGNNAISELEIKYKLSSKSRLIFIKCDVTNGIEFEDSFKKTIEQFGKINIVVNNAGIMTKYMTSWELAIDLNYCPFNSKATGNNVRVMAICPGATFDGFENNIEGKNALQQEIEDLITSGEEIPNPNRILIIQSTDYYKAAFLHIMKNGKNGEVWIAENEQPPRLTHFSTQY